LELLLGIFLAAFLAVDEEGKNQPRRAA
jgi:hypothetical protein